MCGPWCGGCRSWAPTPAGPSSGSCCPTVGGRTERRNATAPYPRPSARLRHQRQRGIPDTYPADAVKEWLCRALTECQQDGRLQRMARTALQNLSSPMSPACPTLDPRVGAQFDLLESRPTVGHQLANEGFQNFIRPVAMSTHREVEHVDGQHERAVGPHPRRDARAPFLVA